MNISELTTNIRSGRYDIEMDLLRQAVTDRFNALKEHRAAQHQVGDKVRLVNIRPKYMVGKIATIKSISRVRASIELDEPESRFHGLVKVHLINLEPV
jgi:hypothetical protein